VIKKSDFFGRTQRMVLSLDSDVSLIASCHIVTGKTDYDVEGGGNGCVSHPCLDSAIDDFNSRIRPRFSVAKDGTAAFETGDLRTALDWMSVEWSGNPFLRLTIWDRKKRSLVAAIDASGNIILRTP
jgi:hypothetical protein